MSPLKGKLSHFCRRLGTRIAGMEKTTCIAKRRHGIRSAAIGDVEYDGAIILIMYSWRIAMMGVCSNVGDIEF